MERDLYDAGWLEKFVVYGSRTVSQMVKQGTADTIANVSALYDGFIGRPMAIADRAYDHLLTNTSDPLLHRAVEIAPTVSAIWGGEILAPLRAQLAMLRAGEAVTAEANILQQLLAKAKPTPGHPNQVMVTLDDGTRVLFRKDFGDRAHSLNGPFKGQGKIDHYNIQIQDATGNTIKNLHIVPDGKGGFITF